MTNVQRAQRTLPKFFMSPGFLGLAVAWAGFSLVLPNFGTRSNATNILLQFGPIALLALGQMVVILVRGFDISVGAVLAISSVSAALAIEQFGMVGIVAAPLTGIAFGLWNGALIGFFAVPPIITTLGTLLLARGLALLITNSGQVVLVTGDPQMGLLDFAFGQFLSIPYSAILTFAVFCTVAVFLSRSRIGRRLFLIGGDPESARLVGIKVNRGFLLAYAICGGCAGLAGLLILTKTGAGLPTDGVGMELNAIAAAVIGGSLLTGGNAQPFRVLIAALFIQAIYTGLSFSAVSPYAGEVVLGAVILFAGLIGARNLNTK
ncbi:ABC transporter permease [uncultured Sulfitobacter sp.]|uniref:ABC transporter permease n=1 Tax=uncultured Sulfitobacter sp. TaxID=191468 RepID=UPI002598C17E|nr:ABC transporter permease [uncultured Sulfitobacter sp.]